MSINQRTRENTFYFHKMKSLLNFLIVITISLVNPQDIKSESKEANLPDLNLIKRIEALEEKIKHLEKLQVKIFLIIKI